MSFLIMILSYSLVMILDKILFNNTKDNDNDKSISNDHSNHKPTNMECKLL